MPKCSICYDYQFEGERCPICGFSANPQEAVWWKVIAYHPLTGRRLEPRPFSKREYAKIHAERLKALGYEARYFPTPYGRDPPEIPLEEGVEVVRPKTIERWREWGVPEYVIQRAIMQRASVRRLREIEETIMIEGFAYPMPRLPEVEAEPWGTAKAIDFEGTIIVRQPFVADRIMKIDRWLYRWEYYRPRIGIKTRTYELIEEIANMWHTTVSIKRVWDIRLEAYAINYETWAASARAVRICQLTEPHLTHPEKKRRAREILSIYKERPSIPRT